MPTGREVGAFALGVVAAAAVIIASDKLLADDDQNPIRVRNKKLRFESEGKNSSWEPDASGSQKWRLKGNKHTSSEYIVSAFGSSDCLNTLSGDSVEIVFQIGNDPNPQTKKFTFKLEDAGNNKTEPVVESTDTMTADNSGDTKKLRINNDPEGAVTEMTVSKGGQSQGKCSFPTNQRVTIDLCRVNCS